MLYNDRSGNDLFLFTNVAGEDYSNCNPYGSHKSMEVYRFPFQREKTRQA